MPISPADTLSLIGGIHGESVEPSRLASVLDSPATRAEIASLVLLVDEMVTISNLRFDALIRFDLKWRKAIYQGEIEYEEEIDAEIRKRLRDWAEGASHLLAQITPFAHLGFAPEPIETSRGRIVEVREMLTPDGEFFEGEELDRLAAEAIQADERGETTGFHVMGQ